MSCDFAFPILMVPQPFNDFPLLLPLNVSIGSSYVGHSSAPPTRFIALTASPAPHLTRASRIATTVPTFHPLARYKTAYPSAPLNSSTSASPKYSSLPISSKPSIKPTMILRWSRPVTFKA